MGAQEIPMSQRGGALFPPFLVETRQHPVATERKNSFGASWKFTNGSETHTQFYFLCCVILGKRYPPRIVLVYPQSRGRIGPFIVETVRKFVLASSVAPQQLCLAFRPTAIPPSPLPFKKIYGRY